MKAKESILISGGPNTSNSCLISLIDHLSSHRMILNGACVFVDLTPILGVWSLSSDAFAVGPSWAKMKVDSARPSLPSVTDLEMFPLVSSAFGLVCGLFFPRYNQLMSATNSWERDGLPPTPRGVAVSFPPGRRWAESEVHAKLHIRVRTGWWSWFCYVLLCYIYRTSDLLRLSYCFLCYDVCLMRYIRTLF